MTEPIEIPPVGALARVADVERTHPDYQRLAQRYTYLRDTYLGCGGYEPYIGRYEADTGSRPDDLPAYTYLQRYPREPTAKWERRVEAAYYPNPVRRIVQIQSGLILRTPPTMAGVPEAVISWGGAGSAGWENQRARIVPWCLVYPTLYAVVDRPSVSPDVRSMAAAPDVRTLAKVEGLDMHSRSIDVRLDE